MYIYFCQLFVSKESHMVWFEFLLFQTSIFVTSTDFRKFRRMASSVFYHVKDISLLNFFHKTSHFAVIKPRCSYTMSLSSTFLPLVQILIFEKVINISVQLSGMLTKDGTFVSEWSTSPVLKCSPRMWDYISPAWVGSTYRNDIDLPGNTNK